VPDKNWATVAIVVNKPLDCTFVHALVPIATIHPLIMRQMGRLREWGTSL